MVFFVIFSSIFSGSILYVSLSTSAKIGTAPVNRIELDEAIKVYGVVITSSFGPISRATKARCKAHVPLTIVVANFEPVKSQNFFSNARACLPSIRNLLSTTSLTACISSSFMSTSTTGIIVFT